MFLWSLEVSFPHPINTYTPAENKIISDDILLKVALEGDKQVNGNSVDIDDCGDDEDDCDVDLPPGGQGNTTSGSDANSIENRLLMNSSLQIREEMFGIETRSTVKVSIDEPVYYGIFRDCHYNEWEQGFRNM